jgi:hypothetical protein
LPWCETCDRFYNPNSVDPDGTCRSCGERISDPARLPTADADADAKVPWHFKVMVVFVVAYLGWRLVQGVDWLLG